MSAAAADAPAFEPLGETVLLLRYGRTADAATNARVHAALRTLAGAELPGVVDLVPAYATLALHYEPDAWTGGADADAPWSRLADAARSVLAHARAVAPPRARAIEVPVCYDAEFAPDLADVARAAGIDAIEFALRHARGEYTVAMLGFAPGFPYLLGLDASLHAPRRASPRTRVPAGSVAIGGAQTGIYPRELPGGWQLIGRTPLALFDVRRESPALFAPGDRVRFRAIDRAAFTALAAGGRA